MRTGGAWWVARKYDPALLSPRSFLVVADMALEMRAIFAIIVAHIELIPLLVFTNSRELAVLRRFFAAPDFFTLLVALFVA